MIVVKSEVKRFVNEASDGELRVSSELFDVINNEVVELLISAIKRTVANGRKTLKPCDL